MTYAHLPKKLQDFIKNHPLLTEITLTSTVFVGLGGTLTALIAAGMLDLIVAAMLRVAHNPEKYKYLMILKNKFVDFVQSMHQKANDWATTQGY